MCLCCTRSMVGEDLLTHAAHLHGVLGSTGGDLVEVLDALAHDVPSCGSLGSPGLDTTPLFLLSILAELLIHPDPNIVLRAMVSMNQLLRLDNMVATLRSAWVETRGTKAEVTLPRAKDPLRVPLVSQATLLKAFAGFLNSKSVGIQLGSLACMSAVLLTPPEDPRASKLFGTGTLSKTFQLCVDVLERSTASHGGEQIALDGLCTDLLVDLLTHNTRISTSLLTHLPFQAVLQLALQQPHIPLHLLLLLRHVVTASAAVEEAAALRGLVLSASFTASLIQQLVGGGGSIATEELGDALSRWQAALDTLVAIHQLPAEVSPINDFIGRTVEGLQAIPSGSFACSSSSILLLIELARRDATLRHSVRPLLLPNALAGQRRRSMDGGWREAESAVLLFSLAQALDPEGRLSQGGSTTEQLEDLFGCCVHAAQCTPCDVLRHHHCALLWTAMSQLTSRCPTEVQQQAFVKRMVAILKSLPMPCSLPVNGDLRRLSQANAMETDDEASQDPSRSPQTEQLKRRIRQLEEENAQRLLRLNQMTAEYKSLEATLVEIREWSQRSIMFDRDKMDELSGLRDFQAKHISCEALTDMRIKDLSDGLEHKAKKLEDTYMKLILLTKAHQKVLGAFEQQQRRNDDLQAELQRLSQVWKAKEDQQEQVLRDLRTTFATATQERITHSASASETVKALEVQVNALTAENATLKERLHGMKAQLQSAKVQGRQQELQIKQQELQLSQSAAETNRLQEMVRRQDQELAKQQDICDRLKEQCQQASAKLQEADGRHRDQHAEVETLKAELNRARTQLRDLDSRLQRYSSVTSLIHSLAKDPENATQATCG
eukprot:GGOE01046143.1.p1 GENE.GGOE01046143.1~~GGOE01046143.1.p1  ORF type:complete len:834 (-),score=249.97 GGOE01046143.1:421-2922(-)